MPLFGLHSRNLHRMDSQTSPERSAQMRTVLGRNTRPELLVRSLLHRMGYRFRLHHAKLPGRPDLVFERRRKVVFIHGCFWHRHQDANCRLTRTPKTRLEYWEPKFVRNKGRDLEVTRQLREAGWQTLILWECQLRGSAAAEIEERLKSFLGPTRTTRL